MSNEDLKVIDVSILSQKGEGQKEAGLRNDLTMPRIMVNGATEI